MTLNLTIPPQMHTDFTPRITVIGVGLAWWGAYLIRFNFSIPPEFLPGFLLGLVIVVVLRVPL